MKRHLAILVALLVTVLHGCSRKAEPPSNSLEVAIENTQNGEVQWVDPNEIRQGPIRRDSLTEEQMERIKALQKTFAEVDGQTVDEWVDSFKRDLNPNSELAIWERMAKAYQSYCEAHDLSLDAKKDAYKVLLLRSMASPEEVLERVELTTLSKSDAKNVMSGF